MQKRAYLIFGLIFLIIEFMVILRNVLIGYNFYLWFCDFAPFLIAIGFFLKKDEIIKAVINFGLITQTLFLLWYFINFSENIKANNPGLGVLILILTIIIHFSSVLALVFTRKTQPKIKTIYWTIGIILGVWLVTSIFTNPIDNINFLYEIPKEIYFYLPLQNILWPILVFLIFALPSHYIQILVYRLSKKKANKI
jgi:hypothetical protein